jgi:hypothetical protein
MKKILLALCISTGVFFSGSALAVEKTKVCVDIKDKSGKVVKDAKGKPKQNCKEMKKHQKLEGTKVPTKK